MSQKATRKSQNAAVSVSEDKEKTDSPVKEMKKKIAHAEKAAAEKTEKPADKTDKSDKTEPADKNKAAEKTQKDTDKSEKHEKSEKLAEKKSEKHEKEKHEKPEKVAEKKVEKHEKGGDKKADKSMEKKAEQEKKESEAKDKSAKPLNGTHNGTAAANGAEDINGTVSDGSEDELVIEEDELFPELTYEDSDTDAFDTDAPSRSFTRRSQVKVTKTPETPRPASEKESDDSKESKLLKLKDDSVTSDRKLRSADSPKPESKKDKKVQDSPSKTETAEEEKRPSKKDLEGPTEEAPKDGKTEKSDKVEVDVVIEIDSAEDVTGAPSRTRVRVSPYSRPRPEPRLDCTQYSAVADYTGNNSTMEMDLSSSSTAEESAADSSFLRGIKGIRGRSSYKLLREVRLTNPNANRPRANAAAETAALLAYKFPAQVEATSVSASLGRPTGAVVGRKRRPSLEDAVEVAEAVEAVEPADEAYAAHVKRVKLFDRFTLPFRSTHRAAEIVGINTDLPLTAPTAPASFESFDPETIKQAAPGHAPAPAVLAPTPTPLLERDSKRCIVM